jgi:hypothetical protein
MGFVRKALFIATVGLSGRVFKDDSKKKPTAKADTKQVRSRKPAKAGRAKPQTARRAKPQAAKRPKPQAARRAKPQAAQQAKPQAARQAKPQAARRAKPQGAKKQPATSQAARTLTAAPMVAANNGTTGELERLADLHGSGALSDMEFAAAKARILGTSVAPPQPDRGSASFQAIEANVTAARRLADLAAQDDESVTTFSSD